MGVLPTRMMPMGVWRKQSGSQTPYVADGLVAWWDGIWNAGLGVHDAAATVWADIIGGHKFTPTAYGHFEQNAFSSDITTATQNRFSAVANSFPANPKTVEICFAVRTYPYQSEAIILSYGASAPAPLPFVYCGWGNTVGIGPKYGVADNGVPIGTPVSASGDGTHVYIGGSLAGSIGNMNLNPQVADGILRIGNRRAGARSFDGLIYCIRFYSRTLSAEEVAANYAVDKARFNLP